MVQAISGPDYALIEVQRAEDPRFDIVVRANGRLLKMKVKSPQRVAIHRDQVDEIEVTTIINREFVKKNLHHARLRAGATYVLFESPNCGGIEMCVKSEKPNKWLPCVRQIDGRFRYGSKKAGKWKSWQSLGPGRSAMCQNPPVGLDYQGVRGSFIFLHGERLNALHNEAKRKFEFSVVPSASK